MSLLWMTLRLPWDVYLTLYALIYKVVAKNNPHDLSAFITYCILTVIQIVLTLALYQTFVGSVSRGDLSVFDTRVVSLLVCIFLAALNYFLLRQRGDAFASQFGSMSKLRQRFLSVLAIGLVLFGVGLFFWSLPPVGPE